MKRSNFFHAVRLPLIPVSVIVAGIGGQAFGQAISLYTPDQSYLEAIATFNNDAGTTGGVTVDGNVNSLPYSTPTTANDSTTTTTITPTLSSSSLSFAFSQSTPDNKSTSSGEGNIFFTSTGATYSIAGGFTMVGGLHTGGDLYGFLLDVTTSTYLYNEIQTSGGNGTITVMLDSSGGSLTGSLTPGDVYEFDADDDLQKEGAQTLSGTTTLTLTATPEPSTWAFIFVSVGMLGAFGFARKSKTAARA